MCYHLSLQRMSSDLCLTYWNYTIWCVCYFNSVRLPSRGVNRIYTVLSRFGCAGKRHPQTHVEVSICPRASRIAKVPRHMCCCLEQEGNRVYASSRYDLYRLPADTAAVVLVAIRCSPGSHKDHIRKCPNAREQLLKMRIFLR